MKFFEKLILIEKRRRKSEEKFGLSDDEIEKDQADREEDDAEAEDEEEAETGQAVEMADPGHVVNGSKKSKKAKKEAASPMDKALVKDSPFTVGGDDGGGEEEGEEDDTQEESKDWIQKAVNPKHKGYCTPMTKETCTPARKALAKRFKKAGRKEKKSGGTGWQGKV